MCRLHIAICHYILICIGIFIELDTRVRYEQVEVGWKETSWGQLGSLLLDGWSREVPGDPFELPLEHMDNIHKHHVVSNCFMSQDN